MTTIKHNIFRIQYAVYLVMLIMASLALSCTHSHPNLSSNQTIDTTGFTDSAHHWYDIYDDDKVINPQPRRPRYNINQIEKIADNILLYQKTNGGWPKNYDMLAILTEDQKDSLKKVKGKANTTFDNGATHSQVEYLVKAYSITKDERYKEACLKGLDFILKAQYANGGWPQFYPDTSGYRKFITFNDGAMIGVMKVLHNILQHKPHYSFIDSTLLKKVQQAFKKGIDCILNCQIKQDSKLTAWCQQHDNIDFQPQGARTFEPASVGGEESAEIVLFLMSIEHPSSEIVVAVQSSVQWFKDSRIFETRVKTIEAPTAVYKYSTSNIDRIVVKDPKAPPIWARLYELGTNKPLFCNRDGIPVYSLAEVDRERRSGYTWYTYEPEKVLKKFPKWQKKWALE